MTDSQKTPTPHKYAEAIKAWGLGEPIQFKNNFFKEWQDYDYPFESGYMPAFLDSDCQWRVKPASVTIWVNCYRGRADGSAYAGGYSTRDIADHAAGSDRLACLPLTFTEGEGL